MPNIVSWRLWTGYAALNAFWFQNIQNYFYLADRSKLKYKGKITGYPPAKDITIKKRMTSILSLDLIYCIYFKEANLREAYYWPDWYQPGQKRSKDDISSCVTSIEIAIQKYRYFMKTLCQNRKNRLNYGTNFIIIVFMYIWNWKQKMIFLNNVWIISTQPPKLHYHYHPNSSFWQRELSNIKRQFCSIYCFSELT